MFARPWRLGLAWLTGSGPTYGFAMVNNPKHESDMVVSPGMLKL